MLDYLDISKKVIAYIVVHIVLYLVFSFIAWDFNPMDWKLLLDAFGRVILVFMEIVIIALIAEHDFD
jgi:hypothetical protein